MLRGSKAYVHIPCAHCSCVFVFLENLYDSGGKTCLAYSFIFLYSLLLCEDTFYSLTDTLWGRTQYEVRTETPK